MLGLLVLSGGALIALVGYHLVRQNFQNIRISMAHLLPDPPVSSAPKRVFSIRSLVSSYRFWLRLMCVASIGLAVLPLTFTFGPTLEYSAHYRVIIDVTASMGVRSGGNTRLSLAKKAAKEIVDKIRNIQAETVGDICLDMAIVGRDVRLHSNVAIDAVVNNSTARPEGGGVRLLISALTSIGGQECESGPTHGIIITDLVPQPIGAAAFDGHLIWYQVGEPQNNLAIYDLRLRTGGLRGEDADLVLDVASYGETPQRVTVSVDGPNGRSDVALTQNAFRRGGWSADIPFEDAGHYSIVLNAGGEFDGDDRIEFDLGEIDKVGVDWQLRNLTKPRSIVDSSGVGTQITVALYEGPDSNLPDGPFVLAYPGWPNGKSGEIGAFMRAQPVLEGVNFDVLEDVAPRGQIVGEDQGLISVIRGRNSAENEIWVAIRDETRGAVVPLPVQTGDTNTDAISLMLFYNALSWVARGTDPLAPQIEWQTPDGERISNARFESDTARSLASTPSLNLLSETPIGMMQSLGKEWDWTPWLFVLALFLLVIEQIIGPVWSRKEPS